MASNDRRVLRTRRTLREALIALILERGWDAISVRDLCERADVGRSTFYVHFADKEELLLSGFDELLKSLKTKHNAGSLAFAEDLFVHAGENLRLFRALIGKKSAQAVMQRFRAVVLELVGADLARLAPRAAHREAAVHYVTGAYIELLTWWVDGRTRVEATEIAHVFHRLTAPVLASLRAS